MAMLLTIMIKCRLLNLSADIVGYSRRIANSPIRKAQYYKDSWLMKFKTIPTIAVGCLVALLLALGNWQLNRSQEKRQYLELQTQRAATGTVTLSATTGDNLQSLRYKKTQLSGHYDVAHQFLLDNQIYAGKAGYFVLTPFILEGEKKAVLVNRGWLPLAQPRTVLPDLQFANAPPTIAGRINQFPSVGIKLAGAETPTQDWPSVVQVVDSAVLARKLGYALFGFQVELDKDAPAGYQRDWQTTTLMRPEQHTAYAMQWFALALTLTILFIRYSRKKTK
jgi:surfeit locus 1 family protein